MNDPLLEITVTGISLDVTEKMERTRFFGRMYNEENNPTAPIFGQFSTTIHILI